MVRVPTLRVSDILSTFNSDSIDHMYDRNSLYLPILMFPDMPEQQASRHTDEEYCMGQSEIPRISTAHKYLTYYYYRPVVQRGEKLNSKSSE
jgi:hypothetical protein